MDDGAARKRSVGSRLGGIDALLFVALFLFAFLLRAWGAEGSLPYVGHPDEPHIVDAATRIVRTGDLNPRMFIYPSLYVYVEAAVVKAHEVWGTWRGYYAGPGSLPDGSQLFASAPGIYAWVRVLTAVVGALCVAMLYVIGRALFGGSRRAGFAAAMLLAVSTLHVAYSHFGLTDVPLTLMGLLTLWAAYRLSKIKVEEEGDGRRLLWASLVGGALVGMTTATKFNGLAVGAVVAAAWAMQWWSNRAGRERHGKETVGPAIASLACVGLGAIGGFLLGEPYALLDWNAFYGGFMQQYGWQDPVSGLGEMWRPIGVYLGFLMSGNGLLFWPAVVGGVLLLANREHEKRKVGVLLLVLPAAYMVLLGRFAVARERNLLIMLPYLALMAGYAVDAVAGWGAKRVERLRERGGVSAGRVGELARWGLTAGAVALLAMPPLGSSVFYSGYQAKPDTRNLAWAWMQERMGEGWRFAAELHPWQTEDWPDVLAFDVENPTAATPLTTRPPEWYAERGYGYVVLSSNYKDAWRDPALWEEYKRLEVVKEFVGDEGGERGPRIVVAATGAEEGGEPAGMEKVGATFQDFGVLVGYEMVPVANRLVMAEPDRGGQDGEQVFTAGQAVGLNLYFRALREGTGADLDWYVWIHLVDPATGGTVAELNVAPLAGQLKNYPEVVQEPHPVARWHRGEMVAGVYNFDLPAGLPQGTYRLEMGMWVPPGGPGASVVGEDGGQADRVVLGQIEVR